MTGLSDNGLNDVVVSVPIDAGRRYPAVPSARHRHPAVPMTRSAGCIYRTRRSTLCLTAQGCLTRYQKMVLGCCPQPPVWPLWTPRESAAAARTRLCADAPLVSTGMLIVEEQERPFLSRSLRLPDRVVWHLLGDDRPDPELRVFLDSAVPVPACRTPSCFRGQSMPVCASPICGRDSTEVAWPLERARLAESPHLAGPLVCEALLSGAGVVLGPLEGASVVTTIDAFQCTVRATIWRGALDGSVAPGVDPLAPCARRCGRALPDRD